VTADEMIAVLEMITRYSYEYLKSLTYEELEKLFKEKY
jgi:hypothetical protein